MKLDHKVAICILASILAIIFIISKGPGPAEIKESTPSLTEPSATNRQIVTTENKNDAASLNDEKIKNKSISETLVKDQKMEDADLPTQLKNKIISAREALEEGAEYQDVLQMLIELNETFPDNQHVLAEIGLLYRDLNNFDESLRYFRDSLEANPLNKISLNAIPFMFKETSRSKEGLRFFEERSLKHPDNNIVKIGLAKMLAANGHYNQALEKYQKVGSEEYVSRVLGIAEIYHSKGHRKNIDQLYKSAIEGEQWKTLSSEDKETLRTNYILNLLDEGKLEEAEIQLAVMSEENVENDSLDDLHEILNRRR